MDESKWAKSEECGRADTGIVVIYSMILCLAMGKLHVTTQKEIELFNDLCKRLYQSNSPFTTTEALSQCIRGYLCRGRRSGVDEELTSSPYFNNNLDAFC